MTGDSTTDAPDRTFRTTMADIDAMATVIATTVSMAERVGGEAAALLLRRALALVQDRHLGVGEAPHTGLHPGDPGLFTPS